MKPEKLKGVYVKTYQELYDLVDRRMRTASIPPAPKTRSKDRFSELRNALLVKMGVTHSIVVSELEKLVDALQLIDSMHAFYREIFTIKVGRTPRDLISKFNRLRRVATEIYNQYRGKIKAGVTSGEVVKAFRSGIGRLISLYKRNDKLVKTIKETIIEISKLPDVTGDLVVIIAGMPQVGKSTLLRRLTRAKPEVSPFPFTTKTIIAGHMIIEPYGKITLIDTPGLLDRSINEKNEIEYKAILALKHLSDLVVYMFDVSPHSYYMLNEQLRVYNDVKNLLEDKELLVVINKIDITPEQVLVEAARKIIENAGKEPLLISAMKNVNIDKLKNIFIDMLMEKVLHQ